LPKGNLGEALQKNGPIIRFGPSRHQASNKVWGTVLDQNRNFQNLDLD
jgi:eukaryotic-like serine/threonine-protein kinase